MVGSRTASGQSRGGIAKWRKLEKRVLLEGECLELLLGGVSVAVDGASILAAGCLLWLVRLVAGSVR